MQKYCFFIIKTEIINTSEKISWIAVFHSADFVIPKVLHLLCEKIIPSQTSVLPCCRH